MARYVVTGGGGFLGGAIVRKLIEHGHQVLSIARGDYPKLRELGVELLRLDLGSDCGKLDEALRGAEGVFHVAAKVDMWGRYEDFYQANVLGTRNLLDASVRAGVKYFVFTSSPSVIADGKDLRGVDEKHPYPKHYEAYYPATKAEAEREVIARNNPNGLRTISLRPHLIFGPGDTNLIPTVLERARAGKLVQIGGGENLSDFTYIDDCVAAHLCALESLKLRPEVGGRAYFISQGAPVKLWEWVNTVLKLNGLPEVKRKMPAGVAHRIAGILEAVCRILPGNPEPRFTKFLVTEMCTDHYFSIGAAKKELGYSPMGTVWERLSSTFV